LIPTNALSGITYARLNLYRRGLWIPSFNDTTGDLLAAGSGYVFVRDYGYITVRPPVRYLYRTHKPITLNFYNNTKNFSAIAVTCGLVWKFIILVGYYANEVDLYSRIPQADFYGSVLYFVWTSFWYLPSYTLLLILVAISFNARSIRLSYILLSLLLLAYSCTLLDYQALNPTPLPFCRGESWNTLLTNSVNKYHPFIFYSTISGALAIYWCIGVTPTHTKLSVFTGLADGYAFSQTKLSHIVFTLFLGSWWAAQEGSWGGWWNWDPSEVFGLVVMIFFTQVIHRHALKHTRYILQLVVQILLITILILYLFIQLNFDLVSHNFGTKADQFVDSYQLLLLLLISTTLLLGYRLGSLVMGCVRSNTQLFLGLRTLRSRVLFTCILLVSTGLSFTDLLNNFSWSIVGTNLVNLPDLSAHYATVSILTLTTLLYKPSLLTLAPTCFITALTHTLPHTVLIRSAKSWVAFNHTLITYVLLVACFSTNQVSTIWCQVADNSQTFLLETLSALGKTYIVLSAYVVEVGYTQSWSNQLSGYGWNVFKDGSVPLVHTFSHPLGANGQAQGMLSASTEHLHSVQVTDPLITGLCGTVLLILVSIVTLATSKPLITC